MEEERKSGLVGVGYGEMGMGGGCGTSGEGLGREESRETEVSM